MDYVAIEQEIHVDNVTEDEKSIDKFLVKRYDIKVPCKYTM